MPMRDSLCTPLKADGRRVVLPTPPLALLYDPPFVSPVAGGSWKARLQAKRGKGRAGRRKARSRKADRKADAWYRTTIVVEHFKNHAPMHDMRITERLGDGVDWPGGNTGSFERAQQIVAQPPPRRLPDHVGQRGSMRQAALVGKQFGPWCNADDR
eukprot:gene31845-36524_t